MYTAENAGVMRQKSLPPALSCPEGEDSTHTLDCRGAESTCRILKSRLSNIVSMTLLPDIVVTFMLYRYRNRKAMKWYILTGGYQKIC